MAEVCGYLKMLFYNLRIIYLETEKRRETLHFYKLWFKASISIFTYSEIKCYTMSMSILIWNTLTGRYRTVSKFLKARICYQINNRFTGPKHFLSKIFGNKDGCFGYAENNGARMFIIKIFQESFILFQGKIFIELFPQFGYHNKLIF